MPDRGHYAYLFEAKGIQKYIFGSGRLRDVVGASDLLARIAAYDCKDLVQAVVSLIKPDRGFSRRGAGAFCAHFSHEGDRDRFRALWRLTLAATLPGLEFAEGFGAGDTADVEIGKAYASSGLRSNTAAGVLPRGGPATSFAPRTGRPAVPGEAAWEDFGLVDAILRPARARSFALAPFDIEKGPAGAMMIRPAYDALMQRVLPPQAPDAPPLLVPRNLSDDEVDRLDNPRFPFPGDLQRLAVVHADLSGLGELMTELTVGKSIDVRRGESMRVEQAVLGAVKAALRKVLSADPAACAEAVYQAREKGKRIRGPSMVLDQRLTRGEAVKVRVAAFRPLVAGGDDITILIGAEHALAFSIELLAALEAAGEGLSACAGIAFVKATTPFLLSHDLAEGLVKFAKTAAKQHGRAPGGAYPSALAFHAPTGTLGERYEEVVAGEMWAHASQVRLTAGPYWLNDASQPSVDRLLALVAVLAGLRGRGALRGLRTTLFESLGQAQQQWRRWRTVRTEAGDKLEPLDIALRGLGVGDPRQTFVIEDAEKVATTPLFDALTLVGLDPGPGAGE